MGRTKATQAAVTAPAAAADTQTVQTVPAQDGGQTAPVAGSVGGDTAGQSAGEQLIQSGEAGANGEVKPLVGGDAVGQDDGEVKSPADIVTTDVVVATVAAVPSLVIVNNSPSLQVIPTTDAVIEPYGSYAVPESVFEDADRIQRLKTEVSALNELKGYEMIELRFSVAATE